MDCFASLAMTVKLSCPRMRVSSTPRLLDSITAASGILDRPPSRTMTAERTFAFSRRKLRPRLARKILPSNEREQGMPGACCTRGLVCNEWKRCAHEHTGTAGALRHSLRNGLTAYAALSLETNSSCLHHCRLDGSIDPVGSNSPPAAWHQPRVSTGRSLSIVSDCHEPHEADLDLIHRNR